VPHRPSVSYEQASATLARRLRGRFRDIEAAILTRIREGAPIGPDSEPEYINGLRLAIRSAIEYSLDSIETGESAAPPIPLALLGQARLAARHDVTLGTVLCRYTLGAHHISDLIVAESMQDPHLLREHLQQLLREQALVLERVVLELGHEYGRESHDRPASHDARLVELVKRRLAGEPIDTSALNYELDRHHLGVVSQGGDSEELLRELAKTVDGRLLRIRPGGDAIWAWIGTRHPIDPDQLRTQALAQQLPEVRLGLGESGTGAVGWGQTHQQALEAFPYAVGTGSPAVRYADVALQAAIEHHNLAAISLYQLYVAPLERQADGDVLLCTLRAYFAAGRNAAAAEGALNVSRQTVSKRLRSIEALLGKPLGTCSPDFEMALRLHDFRDQP
jgi:hypothetical protein